MSREQLDGQDWRAYHEERELEQRRHRARIVQALLAKLPPGVEVAALAGEWQLRVTGPAKTVTYYPARGKVQDDRGTRPITHEALFRLVLGGEP